MAHHVPAPIALGTSLTLHFLVFIVACAKMVGALLGVVEVDLIFPRNETYAPTTNLPIIFAFQNSHLAPFLDPIIEIDAYLLYNANGSTQWTPPDATSLDQLRWANFTNNNTYFAYPTYQRRTFNFETEGIWQLTWTLNWATCTKDSLAKTYSKDQLMRNQSQHTTMLTIRKGAQEVDLVSGTKDKSCSGQEGVAVNITNTLQAPLSAHWEGQGDMCASTASSVPKSDLCRVSIDPTAAASISCAVSLATSSATSSSLACPEEKKGAAERLTIGGLAAMVGALSYLLH
ncbi:hypothetical protein P171DRAFT_122062 [Karstenula rhodostoma CBS 690.94]|uniref:DUF7136 domain-containing protein n=1 Tax=Karstenula rhodostoma CBS 690.94 TaxID=1392251 RepID=A0A9P4U6T5_9PLEO|nr:hypothetical protein P171DRAFT_122062 [Karstenula rhodostoma CBS 690.94]